MPTGATFQTPDAYEAAYLARVKALRLLFKRCPVMRHRTQEQVDRCNYEDLRSLPWTTKAQKRLAWDEARKPTEK